MKESKTVLDYTPWIPDSRSWIPVFVSGPWISGSNRLWYSRFLVPYFNSKASVVFTRDSGFQRQNFPAFRIPRAKISWISKWNPDSLTSREQLCHHFLLLWLKHKKAHCNQRKPLNNGSVLFKINLLLNLNCKWMSLAFDGQDENRLQLEKDGPTIFRVKLLCWQKWPKNRSCFGFPLIESFDIFLLKFIKWRLNEKRWLRILRYNLSAAWTKNCETCHPSSCWQGH